MAAKASQPRRKHVPQRTCVVCGEKTDKRRLTRIVRTPDEGVVVDLTGKRAGRGAYLCSRVECWEKALRGNALERVLKTKISESERESLTEYQPAGDVEDVV